MTLYLPGAPVSRWYWRASLMAASVTSAPPHSNFTAQPFAEDGEKGRWGDGEIEPAPVSPSPRLPFSPSSGEGASSDSRLASCTAHGGGQCIASEKHGESGWR